MISRHIVKSTAPVALRMATGGILLWSGIQKIQFPAAFLSSVYDYQLLSPEQGLIAAVVLPWFEFIVGACLIGSAHVHGAVVFSTVLGLVFVAVQSSALVRGLSISCGCFGFSSTEPIGYNSLGLSIGFLFLSATAFVSTIRQGPN